MQSVVIENTDVRVSRIAFGTASLHHLLSSKRRQHLLETAAVAGITHFDTSPYYGYGLAESDLGVFLAGRRELFTVTTKVGLYPWGGPSHGIAGVWSRKALGRVWSRVAKPIVDWHVEMAARSLNDSLRRLKTNYVDFVFLHEPALALVQTDEFSLWLERERAKGKLRYWGLAGVPTLLAPWIAAENRLAVVLQTQDSVEQKEADLLVDAGRRLQFTYGYLSSSANEIESPSAAIRLGRALQRNATGCVLVSSRCPERVAELGRVEP